MYSNFNEIIKKTVFLRIHVFEFLWDRKNLGKIIL